MKKLPLIFRPGWTDKKDEILDLRRRFYAIIFESLIITQNLEEVLQHIQIFEICCLEFHTVSFQNMLLAKILNQIALSSKVKRLFVKDCTLLVGAKNIASSELKDLSSLVFINSDWRLLEFLRATKVNELKLMHTTFSQSDGEHLENFLLNQTKLDKLAISVQQSEIFKVLKNEADKDYSFKLKKLALSFKYSGDDRSIDEDIVALLNNHQTTLQELETKRKLGETITEAIIRNLRISRLCIEGTNLPSAPLFYNAIPKNKFLKNLVITGELSSLDAAQGLLSRYDQIESLSIMDIASNIVSDLMLFAANNLKRLRHMWIPKLSANTPELPIATLKSFHVEFVEDINEWRAFVVHNPSLEKISIKWITPLGSPNYETLNIVTTSLRGLKQMTFGPNFQPSRRMLEMINLHCPDFQILQCFLAQDQVQIASLGSMKVHQFGPQVAAAIFPKKPMMWDVEEREFYFDVDQNDSDDDDEDDRNGFSENSDMEEDEFSDDGDDDFDDDLSEYEDEYMEQNYPGGHWVLNRMFPG